MKGAFVGEKNFDVFMFYKFSSHLGGNVLYVHFKFQPVGAV
jgi:hypothetical protein